MLNMNPYILGATALFGPLDIPGCVFWFRSDSGITKDGSDMVSSWADRSGNGNDVGQVWGARQPLWVDAQLNGYPEIRFDGIDDVLGGSFTLNQPCTLFLVYKHVTIGATSVNDTILNSPGGSYAGVFGDTTPRTLLYDTGGLVQYSGNIANGVYAIGISIFNTASSALYENATLRGSGVLGGSALGGIMIGAIADIGSRATNIYVGEVIGYNSALVDSDRTLVANYLNGRYLLY